MKSDIDTRKLRIKNKIKNYFSNPYNIIVLISVILLSYLIIVPLVEIFATTFRVVQRDVRRIPGSKPGDFTLYYWTRLLFSELSSSLLYKPLLNSLFIAFSVSIISITMGGVMAWLLVRSDIKGKKFFSSKWHLLPYGATHIELGRSTQAGGSIGKGTGTGSGPHPDLWPEVSGVRDSYCGVFVGRVYLCTGRATYSTAKNTLYDRAGSY